MELHRYNVYFISTLVFTGRSNLKQLVTFFPSYIIFIQFLLFGPTFFDLNQNSNSSSGVKKLQKMHKIVSNDIDQREHSCSFRNPFSVCKQPIKHKIMQLTLRNVATLWILSYLTVSSIDSKAVAWHSCHSSGFQNQRSAVQIQSVVGYFHLKLKKHSLESN